MKSSPPSRSSSPSRPRSSKSAPVAKTPLDANERGVLRRAKRKKQQKRKNWGVWLGFAAISAMLAGVALGIHSVPKARGKWPHLKGVWGELKEVRAKVATKKATLHDLRVQLAGAQKRLAGFNRGSGRERALAENGFVRPGERILLFPPDPNANR